MSQQTSFEFIRRGDVVWVVYPGFAAYHPDVICGFSCRTGGVSTTPYSSLNMGWTRGDNPKLVEKNHLILCDAAGLNPERIVRGRQIHSDKVLCAGTVDASSYGDNRKMLEGYDAYFTRERQLTLLTYHADCMPVFIACSESTGIAMIHAGWRSFSQGIVEKTIRELCRSSESRPGTLSVMIGPHLRACCFETDSDVIEALKHHGFDITGILRNEKGKFLPGLAGILKKKLLQSGVREDRIFDMDLCTSCHPEFFYSHRRDAGKCGIHAGFIQRS